VGNGHTHRDICAKIFLSAFARTKLSKIVLGKLKGSQIPTEALGLLSSLCIQSLSISMTQADNPSSVSPIAFFDVANRTVIGHSTESSTFDDGERI
jgi:hypothetical protein